MAIFAAMIYFLIGIGFSVTKKGEKVCGQIHDQIKSDEDFKHIESRKIYIVSDIVVIILWPAYIFFK